MRIALLGLMIFLGVYLVGCAPQADYVSNDLKTGMSTKEVQELLGAPDKVHRVRFEGHEMDYIVWEYAMVPDVPV